MNQQQAEAIVRELDQHWCHGTPASDYPNSRCLGMALSDTIGDPGVTAEVEEQVRQLFPTRLSAPRPVLPMFQCCNSQAIPAFNNHPDTTLADLRLVVTSAVS